MLDFLIPVHTSGKVIIVIMWVYTAYVLIRLLLVYLTVKQPNQQETLQATGQASQSSAEESYKDRAFALLSAIASVQPADWKAALSVLHEQELAKLRFARTAPNALLLMGLLGTVLGLAQTVGSLVEPLGNALNNTTPQEVFSLLSFTLQQMGVAFSCTFWAIGLAILVNAASGWMTRHVMNTLNRWDVCVIRDVLPQVMPKSVEAQVDLLRQTATEIKNIVIETRHFMAYIAPVMREAAEQFQKVLSAAGEAMQKSIGTLTDTVTTMQRRLEDVSSSVGAGAQALTKGSEELRKSTESLAEYHENLRNAHAELLNVFQQARHDLENQIEGQLKQIGRLDENFRRNAQEIVARIHEASERIGECITAFREAGDRFTKEGVNIHTQVTSYHRQMEESLDRLFKDHRWAIDEVEKSVRSISDTLKVIADSPVYQQSAVNNGIWKDMLQRLDTIAGNTKRMAEQRQTGTEATQENYGGGTTAIAPTGDGGPRFPGTIVGIKPLPSAQKEPPAPATATGESVEKLADNIRQLNASVEALQGSIHSFQSLVSDLSEVLSSLDQYRPDDGLSLALENLNKAVSELTCAIQKLIAERQNTKPRRTLLEQVVDGLSVLKGLLRRSKKEV